MRMRSSRSMARGAGGQAEGCEPSRPRFGSTARIVLIESATRQCALRGEHATATRIRQTGTRMCVWLFNLTVIAGWVLLCAWRSVNETGPEYGKERRRTRA